ncbi:hypothetical protein M0811_08759 [Anaeramoeba ignava]|uniref:HNH endonuclease n=1 Tax=Anaeramoeba ignava TaxID=1746090 RepID=A0A9Q0LIL1_ANAIG|nr:hypothetical protein M0811_08759 [Anaeramoeba ignava]
MSKIKLYSSDSFSDEKRKSKSDSEDSSEIESDSGEEIEGQCELCGTTTEKITIHHLIPKLIIKRMKRRKKKVVPIFAKICRKCHSTLHDTFDHKTLATRFSSIEEIRNCEELKSYLEWKSKRK